VERVNRLADEQSPYLRQHASNPVAWFAWGPDAFAYAAEHDLPLFVSIGYSACHWCHVMAHESFEDPEVAAVLNDRFVPVKVDREERPDVDAVYMAATVAHSGHGGWPMSVFLTPDGRPFFAGTYFPPRDRGGLPGFRRLLLALSEAWRTRRDDVERHADALTAAAADQAAFSPGPEAHGGGPTGRPAARRAGGTELDPPWDQALVSAVEQLSARFDRRWGGFGPAPKFPQPALVELCLRRHRLDGDPGALAMAEHTLRAMATGGVRDHLGGGFCRYATDDTWTVPHFEKMLYDQAGLVRAYLHAWQVTGRPQWMTVVEDTVGYVLRDLDAGGGALCSSEDADSEGEEGRFYLWSAAELEAVLGDEAPAAARRFGVVHGPNFEGRHILRLDLDAELVPDAATERWRRALLAARAQRVRPGRDDKVLTEWNAMFCSALAEAAAATGRADWAHAALRIGRFLLGNLRAGDGRWLRSWRQGRARHLAFAADHAWLVDCFTRLAELTGDPGWLESAACCAGDLLRLFGADDGGPLRTTGKDAEALVVRPTEVLDGVTPSASAVAGAALLRLGALRADEELSQAGAGLVSALWPVVARQPLAVPWALLAGELAAGVTEVVVAGDRPDLLALLRRRYEPALVVLWGERTGSPLWEGRADGRAYVCRHRVCAAPADTPEELEACLEAVAGPGQARRAPAGR
jgi:uncharacterized protein YyaL (SSP411 family)